MQLFKKKQNLIECIPFMAIISAINVIFVLLSSLIPYLLIVPVFVLPLSSALVILICNKKYFPIYFAVTLILCLLIASWNISDILFFIIPSIITGFIFGLFLDLKISFIYSLPIASVINLLLTYISIPLFNAITKINLLDIYASIFSISKDSNYDLVIFTIIFVIGFLQEILTYMFLAFTLKKINFHADSRTKIIPLLSINFVFVLLTIFSSLFKLHSTVMLFILTIHFSIHLLIWILLKKSKLNIIIIISSLFIFIFLQGLLYSFIPSNLVILIYEIPSLIISFVALSNILFDKSSK